MKKIILLEAITNSEHLRKKINNISDKDYEHLMSLDSKTNLGKNKVGPYCETLGKWYNNDTNFMNTLKTIENDLKYSFSVLPKLKQQGLLKNNFNLISFSRPQEFIDYIKSIDTKSNREVLSDKKNDITKVFDNDQYSIIIPLTKEASILYGKGTKWCTAALKDNLFDDYSNKGPLFICINKKTKRKFQYHMDAYGDVTLMDESDSVVSFDEIQEFIPLEVLRSMSKVDKRWGIYFGDEDDVINIYNSDEYLVISPNTLSAARKYGSGTRWLISMKRDSDNTFIRQSENNKFIIIINKNDNSKLLFTLTETGNIILNIESGGSIPNYLQSKEFKNDYPQDLLKALMDFDNVFTPYVGDAKDFDDQIKVIYEKDGIKVIEPLTKESIMFYVGEQIFYKKIIVILNSDNTVKSYVLKNSAEGGIEINEINGKRFISVYDLFLNVPNEVVNSISEYDETFSNILNSYKNFDENDIEILFEDDDSKLFRLLSENACMYYYGSKNINSLCYIDKVKKDIFIFKKMLGNIINIMKNYDNLNDISVIKTFNKEVINKICNYYLHYIINDINSSYFIKENGELVKIQKVLKLQIMPTENHFGFIAFGNKKYGIIDINGNVKQLEHTIERVSMKRDEENVLILQLDRSGDLILDLNNGRIRNTNESKLIKLIDLVLLEYKLSKRIRL